MEKAKWIACPENFVAPVISKTFTLSSPVSASIAVTGLGFFTLFINGKRVSDQLFVPALTDYEARDMRKWSYPLYDITTHRIFYLRYDVSSLVHDGENLLELRLGPGWYRQEERYAEGPMSFGRELKGWFCAEFLSASGEKTYLRSDGTELCRHSQITYSNLFVGEVIDANVSAENAETAPVKVVPAPDSIFEEQTCPSDRVIRTIKPTFLHKNGDRAFYDAGESISGRPVVIAGGRPGEKITLRFADELTPEGELDCASTGGLCRLRSGKYQIQQDVFIQSGEKTVFAPEYVWHAFRYIEITGSFDELTVDVIHTDAPVIAEFESSAPELNWLFDAYIRTQLDNLHNCISSDCPHRERLGYTGDGQIAAKSAMLTLDAKGVYKKWIQDILDCQDVLNGHVQHTAPAMGGGGGPGGWGCAIVIVPDEYDRHYGDREMLEKCYPHMKSWISYLKSHSTHGLVTREEDGGWCLGDWATLHINHSSARFVNTCYLLDCLTRMTRIALELGYTEDAKAYQAYEKYVRAALVREFRDGATGSYHAGIQGSDAFAVLTRLEGWETAFQNMAKKFADLGYFDSGFLATEYIVDQLITYGEENVAYDLLTSHKLGSYWYMAEHGATTVWEDFDGRESHNHPMFGAPARHLLDGFLGITQPEDSKAYARLLIAPKVPAKLEWAKGSTVLPCGKVAVSFENNGETVSFTVNVPEGVPAEFVYGDTKATLVPGENSFVLPYAGKK